MAEAVSRILVQREGEGGGVLMGSGANDSSRATESRLIDMYSISRKNEPPKPALASRPYMLCRTLTSSSWP